MLGPITYTLESPDGGDRFSMETIDDTSAYLSVKELDFEDQFSYQLTIIASVMSQILNFE